MAAKRSGAAPAGQAPKGPQLIQTLAEAEAACERLAAESPDRDTHRWVPTKDEAGDWRVAKIGPLPPGQRASGTEQRADHEPPAPEDLRSSLGRNNPYGAI
jgi:hypothetical protein